MQIYETPHYGKLFRLDGFNMTSEKEEFVYHENLIHPALTAHAAPKKVLIIGGGDGGSSEEALKHPSVEQVTMVEIDGDVIQVAKEHFQAVHNGRLRQPEAAGPGRRRDEVRARDAGEIRPDRARPERPDGAGGGALLGSSSSSSCARALAPGGALTLHIGSPVARPERVAELAQRLNRVFRIVRPYTMYIPLYGSLWAMAVCSDKLDPEGVHRRRDRPAHRGAQAAGAALLQRRDPRGRVRAAELRPGPGDPGAPEAAGPRPPAGRGTGRSEVITCPEVPRAWRRPCARARWRSPSVRRGRRGAGWRRP